MTLFEEKLQRALQDADADARDWDLLFPEAESLGPQCVRMWSEYYKASTVYQRTHYDGQNGNR